MKTILSDLFSVHNSLCETGSVEALKAAVPLTSSRAPAQFQTPLSHKLTPSRLTRDPSVLEKTWDSSATVHIHASGLRPAAPRQPSPALLGGPRGVPR